MADLYCAHNAYGSTFGAVPAWGVPQEGDGSATAPAATVGIASITVNAVATAGNTVVICGVTLTAVASGATVAQFNVGASTTAQATNLATAFNAATGVVGVLVANGQPQLRNLLYARATGALVEIMMRIGSASLNHATNSNVAITQSGWSSALTIVQFIGGVGGCYGTFINTIAMGVSNSIAAMTYGMWFFKPYVGIVTASDLVWVRTGDNQAISFTSSSVLTLNGTYPVNLVFDTNYKWTGDGANGVLSVALTLTSGSLNAFSPCSAAAQYGSWDCLRRGNFLLTVGGASSGNTTIAYSNAGFNSSFVADGVTIIDNISGGGTVVFGCSGTSGYEGYNVWRKITYSKPTSSNTMTGLIYAIRYLAKGGTVYEGCDFTYNLTGATNPGPLIGFDTGLSTGYALMLKNCSFNGYAAGIDLYSSAMTWHSDVTSFELIVDGCSGVKMPSAYCGIAASSNKSAHANQKSFTYGDVLGNFRYENNRAVSEFILGASFPTLSATLFDGVTPWSMRLIWLNGVLNASSSGYCSPSRVATRLASGIRALSLEMYIPDSLTGLTPLSGYVSFNYTDISGISRTEYVYLSSLATSAASWVANGTTGYSAKKVSLNTTYSVLGYSEITAQVVFTGSPPTGVRTDIYIDPAIVVT